ncbi:L-rhamnose-binding lectin CSL3-like [Diadema antillarum]|uniref:L-rhamnose-binding lectin CSL3-like n=1 Tax=Diadema antillarum TaxID=105358 RepID=UPI003A8ABC88
MGSRMEVAALVSLVVTAVLLKSTCGAETSALACEGETLSISCDANFIIRIFSASYGRQCSHICLKGSPSTTTNCDSDKSLSVVTSACDGKRSCTVGASNSVFDDPCVGTYKYLYVTYECQSAPPPSSPSACLMERSCEHESLSLKCPKNGEVIYICDALYGRQTKDICPRSDGLLTTCAATTSVARVRDRCHAKAKCSVDASNQVFGDPCMGTFKYLQIEYVCAKKKRVCEHSTLKLKCPSGQTILIREALYGRQKGPSVCPHPQIKTQECSASSAPSLVKNSCDGKNSCEVKASNGVFGDPCVGTYKYLEVLYQCVSQCD